MATDAQIEAGEYVLRSHLGSAKVGPLFDAREVVVQIIDAAELNRPADATPKSFSLKLDVGDLREALKIFHDDVERLCGTMTRAIEAMPEDRGDG